MLFFTHVLITGLSNCDQTLLRTDIFWPTGTSQKWCQPTSLETYVTRKGDECSSVATSSQATCILAIRCAVEAQGDGMILL